MWKFPFTQPSEHEVDLAEDSLTLNPPYGQVGPAGMWRSVNRRHGKLSEGEVLVVKQVETALELLVLPAPVRVMERRPQLCYENWDIRTEGH